LFKISKINNIYDKKEYLKLQIISILKGEIIYFKDQNYSLQRKQKTII